MASVVKIGHVSLRTSDLDRMVTYYTEVLDFDLVDRGADAAYLAADIDHHCVAIMRAPAAEPVHLAFQIAGSIEDAEADLAKPGSQPRGGLIQNRGSGPCCEFAILRVTHSTSIRRSSTGASAPPPGAHRSSATSATSWATSAGPSTSTGKCSVPLVGLDRRLLRLPP